MSGRGPAAAAAAVAPAVAPVAGHGLVHDAARRTAFRRSILAWYRREGRRFPFRGTTDPYLILVSETILQQTQVSRGGPAWEAFTTRFPTVESLAASSPADVLRAWQGLGYNRRAINLRRAALVVVEELGGRFPADVAGLERLPGVGPYTARAVASIAYGQPVGAVDTNVRRVLGRSIAGDPGAVPPRELQALADALAGAAGPADADEPRHEDGSAELDRPGDWTAALMDLGSTVCRARAPRCDACPVAATCAYALRKPTALGPPPATARRDHAVRERAEPFEQSNRWLRGRILDRLRAVDGDGWAVLDEPIGSHDRRAMARALAVLADEGLIELDQEADAGGDPGADLTGLPPRARLPLA